MLSQVSEGLVAIWVLTGEVGGLKGPHDFESLRGLLCKYEWKQPGRVWPLTEMLLFHVCPIGDPLGSLGCPASLILCSILHLLHGSRIGSDLQSLHVPSK